MKVFYNKGMGNCLLLGQTGDVVLVAAIDRDEFVVATSLAPNGSWTWGTYYKDLGLALKDFTERI